MDKIKIITDTASDVSLETAEKYGIHLIPINLNIGGKNVKDRYEITCEEFYKYLETSDEIPKTSQISVAEHISEFKKFSDEYSIIYIPISSAGSGTMQSAMLAKNEILEENPNADITIVDSMTYSYGYGFWAVEAAKMVSAGAEKEEIISMLKEKLAKTDVIFTTETLEYLQKGGRISPTAKIVANILDINPILKIEDGLVVGKDKVRGKKKVFPKMMEIINQNALQDKSQTITLLHGNAPEKAETVKKMIEEKTGFTNIITEEVGPTVGIHAGPGVIGIAYLANK